MRRIRNRGSVAHARPCATRHKYVLYVTPLLRQVIRGTPSTLSFLVLTESSEASLALLEKLIDIELVEVGQVFQHGIADDICGRRRIAMCGPQWFRQNLVHQSETV